MATHTIGSVGNAQGQAWQSNANVNPMDQLYRDIIRLIFFQCLSTNDFKGFSALARVNTHWNQYSQSKTFWSRLDLKQLCLPGLNILDAQAQGIIVDDEPSVDKLAVLKSFKELVSKVEDRKARVSGAEDNTGLTLLTMCRGITLDQFKGVTEQMLVGFVPEGIPKKLGEISVKKTYVVLVTNTIFAGSRYGRKSRNGQCFKVKELKRECISKHGCILPNLLEYVTLCVFTKKVFNQCLYGGDYRTLAFSSTQFAGYSLVVGAVRPHFLVVHGDCQEFESDDHSIGIGGLRKF